MIYESYLRSCHSGRPCRSCRWSCWRRTRGCRSCDGAGGAAPRSSATSAPSTAAAPGTGPALRPRPRPSAPNSCRTTPGTTVWTTGIHLEQIIENVLFVICRTKAACVINKRRKWRCTSVIIFRWLHSSFRREKVTVTTEEDILADVGCFEPVFEGDVQALFFQFK